MPHKFGTVHESLPEMGLACNSMGWIKLKGNGGKKVKDLYSAKVQIDNR